TAQADRVVEVGEREKADLELGHGRVRTHPAVSLFKDASEFRSHRLFNVTSGGRARRNHFLAGFSSTSLYSEYSRAISAADLRASCMSWRAKRKAEESLRNPGSLSTADFSPFSLLSHGSQA